MKRSFFYLLTRAGFSFLVAAQGNAASAADDLQWPMGKNICAGIWSYDEMQECEHPSHGPDKSRPIVEANGQVCGYAKKTNSCWHGQEIVRTITTAATYLERDDHNYSDAELQGICEIQSKTQNLSEHESVTGVSFENMNFHAECHDRDFFKKCQRWTYKSELKCNFNVSSPAFGPDQSCGESEDISKPLTCQTGFRNKLQRSTQCPTTRHEMSRGSDATSLMQGTEVTGFACSTGDHLPANSVEETHHKYLFLVARLAEITATSDPDWPNLVRAVKSLLTVKSASMSDEEKEDAVKITKTLEHSVSALKTGQVFSSAEDCVHDQARSLYWACQSKQVTLEIDALDAYVKLNRYAGLSIKLSYDHGCSVASSDLKVRFTNGQSNLLLAPNLDGVIQTIVTSFDPSRDTSTITIDINPVARLNSVCRISIESVDLTVDVDRLQVFSNLIVSKLALLNETRLRLLEPADTQTVASLLESLENNFSAGILEQKFKCQADAQSLRVSVPDVCQVGADAKATCLDKNAASQGITPAILDKIREDSCLLGEIKALKQEAQCESYTDQNSHTDNICGDRRRSILDFLNQEFAMTYKQAKDLVEALSSESIRLSVLSADLSHRVQLVIDSLKIRLKDLEEIR